MTAFRVGLPKMNLCNELEAAAKELRRRTSDRKVTDSWRKIAARKVTELEIELDAYKDRGGPLYAGVQYYEVRLDHGIVLKRARCKSCGREMNPIGVGNHFTTAGQFSCSQAREVAIRATMRSTTE